MSGRAREPIRGATWGSAVAQKLWNQGVVNVKLVPLEVFTRTSGSHRLDVQLARRRGQMRCSDDDEQTTASGKGLFVSERPELDASPYVPSDHGDP